jgi:hypothetical protein
MIRFYYIVRNNVKKIILFGVCLMLVGTMIPCMSADEPIQGFVEEDFRFDVMHGIRIYWNYGKFVSSVFNSWNPLYQLLLKHVDIVSFSITEDEGDPDVLLVEMTLRDLSLSERRSVYAVYWEFEGVTYYAGANVHSGGAAVGYQAGYFTSGNEAVYEDVAGEIDETGNTVSWVIPRDVVGSPSSGDVLRDIHAQTFLFYQKDCMARIKVCLAIDRAGPLGSNCYSYELVY